MKGFAVFALLSVGALANHSPLHKRDGKSSSCSVKKGALKVLKGLGAEGSQFCSSLLDIIPATITSTSVVTPTSTISTVTSTFTFSDPNCVPPVTVLRRGVTGVPTVTLPPVLSAFPTSVLSSACSRLGVTVSPPTTITITNTAATAVTSTVGLIQTTTVCIGQPACAAPGQQCDLSRPDLCCNQICFNAQPVPTCG
ncbi:hypothetical protein QBC39DRAFT_361592 [Podospora conica]|nr:hypothetical protein QBC39DRAFT_361592 [Schizothecium conicum]